MMKTQEKQSARNGNIDILRLLAMFMVVFQHLVTHSHLFDLLQPGTVDWYIWRLLYTGTIVAVNCFVLITGYFSVQGSYKKVKVFKLWGKTLFYSVAISVVFLGLGEIGLRKVAKSFLPVVTKEYWFITVYLALYLLSPYINRCLQNLSKSEFRSLMITMTCLFVVWNSVMPRWSTLDDTGGFGLLWFVYLYVLGAFLAMEFDIKKIKRWTYLIGYLLFIGIIVLIKTLFMKMGFEALSDAWYGYNTIFVLGAAVCLFCFFASGNAAKGNYRVIKWFSPVALDIYLITEQAQIKERLFTEWLKIPEALGTYSLILFVLYSLGSVIAICIVCLLIGKIRMMLASKLAAKAAVLVHRAQGDSMKEKDIA